MTDDQIDLLLLKHLDPTHRTLRDATARRTTRRLKWLIEQGYILRTARTPKWMKHEAVHEVRYSRSESGERRMVELMGRG